jgi:Icc-related predicted phosphoesterase
MRLAILSDTHGFHRGMGAHGNPPIPDADVLVHAGDYSRDHGSWLDTVRFAQWMGSQPHKHKVLCPGNHDQAVSQNPTKAQALFEEHGIHMLGKKPVEIDGVRFDGGPYMPVSGWDPPWGFEMADCDREKEWDRIERCHVLVTHTPPMGILDQTNQGPRIGDPILRQRVFAKIRPRLHIFGHVHEARGIVQEEGIWFMNAASNTRGTYARDEPTGTTYMSMGIRDAYTFDLEVK